MSSLNRGIDKEGQERWSAFLELVFFSFLFTSIGQAGLIDSEYRNFSHEKYFDNTIVNSRF
jgi:hypothetical protein